MKNIYYTTTVQLGLLGRKSSIKYTTMSFEVFKTKKAAQHDAKLSNKYYEIMVNNIKTLGLELPHPERMKNPKIVKVTCMVLKK